MITSYVRHTKQIILLCWELTYVLQEDVLLLYPFTEGSKFISYDRHTHRASLNDNASEAHTASYVNASRVTTYLRGGVEQFHGGLKGTYKVGRFRVKCDLTFIFTLRFWKECRRVSFSQSAKKLCRVTTTCMDVIGALSGLTIAWLTWFTSAPSVYTTTVILSFSAQHQKHYRYFHKYGITV